MTREEAIEANKSTCCLMSDDLLNKIYDDFESRTCENCKHLSFKFVGNLKERRCKLLCGLKVYDHMSCNKFERRSNDK